MLGSRNDSRKSVVEPSESFDSAPEPFPIRPQQQVPANTTAVIGPKIRFRGELVGEEDLVIQGQVDGTVDLKGHNLTVGEHGIIKANVMAKTITIKGTVEGDVFGEERIAIMSSSNVKGNLTAERVVLEDGAKFRGSIDMDMDDSKDSFKRPKANGATTQAAQTPNGPTANGDSSIGHE